MTPSSPFWTHSASSLRCAAALSLTLALAWTSSLAAQGSEPATRTEEQARKQAEKAKTAHRYAPPFIEHKLLGLEETGGLWAIRPFGVAFGDIKPGSGIALGPSSGYTFSNGSIIQAKAEYSINRFKLGQFFYQAPPLADGRFIVNGRARWQDAPKLAVYGIGPASGPTRANYSEERTEVSAQALANPVSFIRLAGGTAYEKYQTGAGSVLLVAPFAPGLSADPTYLHSYGSAALDWRESPGYSRSGAVLEGVLHDYRDRRNGPYSFRELDGLAQGLLPILHGNMVIDLAARVWTTDTTGGDVVPFFLMPHLGGSDFLRGFRQYRFRDDHAMLLTGQYRWYAQEYMEGVLFYEAGKVASQRSDLDLKHLERSYGIGLHFHTPTATVLRLEVARSREGTRLIFGFSPAAF